MAAALKLSIFMRRFAADYYRHENILGRDGDFITAPEISQLFGELIGAWLVEVWRRLGSPRQFIFTEMGVGRATLAADMLRVFRLEPKFLAAARWHPIEINPHFRRLGEEKLKGVELHWHRRLGTIPRDCPQLIVANEFFDALPIEQYKSDGDRWQRAVMRRENGHWVREFRPSPPPPSSPLGPLRGFGQLRNGQIWERMLAAAALMRAVARRLAEGGGHLLAIDYGGDDGIGDSLKLIRDHEAIAADKIPLANGGDLSANVDFGQLRRAASTFAVAVSPLIRQGDFLRRLGLEERLAALIRQNPHRTAELTAAARRLVAPPMGELFKVMAVSSKRAKLPFGVFG